MSSDVDVGDSVASGHDVIVVDVLDEGLNARSLQDLLLSHRLRDLERCTVNSGHERVSELVLLSRIIERLDDDRLATGITACEDDHNLAGLDANQQREQQRKESGRSTEQRRQRRQQQKR